MYNWSAEVSASCRINIMRPCIALVENVIRSHILSTVDISPGYCFSLRPEGGVVLVIFSISCIGINQMVEEHNALVFIGCYSPTSYVCLKCFLKENFTGGTLQVKINVANVLVTTIKTARTYDIKNVSGKKVAFYRIGEVFFDQKVDQTVRCIRLMFLQESILNFPEFISVRLIIAFDDL